MANRRYGFRLVEEYLSTRLVEEYMIALMVNDGRNTEMFEDYRRMDTLKGGKMIRGCYGSQKNNLMQKPSFGSGES
jgi:hypothetical protein